MQQNYDAGFMFDFNSTSCVHSPATWKSARIVPAVR